MHFRMGKLVLLYRIDKLSILVTVAFAYWAFKEKLSRRLAPGLVFVVAGTMLLLV
ncbi:hypothetical protein [Bacillus sp. FJAT-27225]|uniref:hypothetical protein n=1 Tax=Bacillus sp. FJAT-27225 TaxID=1743144 RepID=UPI0020C767F4|nr:hypothetical protein [Bacillus sp. FJAT-27225]